jgi:hypothetical protein
MSSHLNSCHVTTTCHVTVICTVITTLGLTCSSPSSSTSLQNEANSRVPSWPPAKHTKGIGCTWSIARLLAESDLEMQAATAPVSRLVLT